MQFIPAAPAKTEVNRKGRTITLRHALRARFVHHQRQQLGKKQESLLRDAVTKTGYVNWKDTDGARRRGWNVADGRI